MGFADLRCLPLSGTRCAQREVRHRDEPAAGKSSPATTQASAPGGGGGDGTATLTLESGDILEFSSVECKLDRYEQFGQPVLFSTESPRDVDASWSAQESFDGLTLELSGTTVTGSGNFFKDGALGSDPVPGTFEANC